MKFVDARHKAGHDEVWALDGSGAIGRAHHGGDAVVGLDARVPADGAELAGIDHEIRPTAAPTPLSLPKVAISRFTAPVGTRNR